MVMFRFLAPAQAADLARSVRQNTGGMDSGWPHLMIIGSPSVLADLVKRHERERADRG
jgi:hypothetical protein